MTGGQNVKSVNNSLRATYNPTFYSQGIPLGHKRHGAVNDSKAMAGCCADVELPPDALRLGMIHPNTASNSSRGE